MKEFSRTQRMGDQIQRELAQLIQQQISDPRVGMVTVSGVHLSKDLAHAKVFITVLDDKQDAAKSVQVLNHAAGFLRHELARRTLMRVIPQLRFIYDPTVERGANLSALINAAVSSDRDHGAE
ncbi:MAG: 30S ribosome-binding factor RbfA [Gammaproteobacteria bacterium]